MDMKKSKTQNYSRSYSQTTLKILFALSRNECAEPSCTNPVILAKTEYDEEAVSAQIAHIYAINDDGPRGKPNLTQEERNHHGNLLLLCPTHHVGVDKQYNTYPATVLQKWKRDHERKLPSPLIDSLVRQFGSSKPESSEEDKATFLKAKAAEYQEMRHRLAELTATDEQLSKIMPLATAAIDRGDFVVADENLQKAEQLQFELVTKEALRRQANFRLERGNAALLAGNLDVAVDHFEVAAGFFSGVSKDDEATTRHTFIQQLRYYAYRYRDHIPLYAAKKALTKNLSIWRQAYDVEKWCMTMNALGGVLVRLSEYDDAAKRKEHLICARDCYEKVRNICREFDDSAPYATASLDLANVYSAHEFSDTGDEYKNNLEFAIELQIAALDYFTETTQPHGWGIVQHNLGCSFTRLSELSTQKTVAVDHLRKAIEHAELSFRVRSSENELQFWIASCRTLGEAHISLSRLSLGQESESHRSRAQEILEEAQTKISKEEHLNQWREIEEQMLRLNHSE